MAGQRRILCLSCMGEAAFGALVLFPLDGAKEERNKGNLGDKCCC